MNSCTLRITVMTTVCFAGVHTTRAELPADRAVYLYMYEIPGDPESGVVFSVSLDIQAVDIDGNWVGWEITSIEFREPGTPDTVWLEASPMVDSPDGLWWVEHNDPQDPQRGEFTVPPLLEGTALAQDPSTNDLGYTLEGSLYNVLPGGLPHGATAAINYTFTLVGEETPVREGDNEPVELPDRPREAQ